MKHIKKFSSNIDPKEVVSFCEDNLSYLLDSGSSEIKIYHIYGVLSKYKLTNSSIISGLWFSILEK